MPASSNRKIDPTLFVRLLPDQFIESDDTIFNRSHLSLIDFLKSITYAYLFFCFPPRFDQVLALNSLMTLKGS
ncbi:unnamed protein product [Lactuca virosa]|uniref:Uncharacterized protein n=1 Tax=Lactuca virosa TaxID=75947 RepID=A0AAU9LNZ4_9ASTR|nr:unnamed protein product [Lactuca virosa]